MVVTEPKLTTAGLGTLRVVCQMPLISAKEVAQILGVTFSTASRRLAALEEDGWIEGALMGAASPPARRYRLTPAGADQFYEPEVYTHFPRQLNRLAGRLQVAEALYGLVPEMPSLAGFTEFQSFEWRYSEGFDAWVEYANGTCLFVWSGPWHSRRLLQDRIRKAASLAAGDQYWPRLFCVVASDRWQAHQAAAVVAVNMTESFLVVCAKTGYCFGNRAPAARPEPYPPGRLLSPLGNAISAGLPRMMRDFRSGPDAHMVHRILQQVEQFPGSNVATIGRALGSHPRNVAPKVRRLLDEGMLVQCDGHHYLGNAALTIAAQRDRVHVSRVRRRFGLRGNGLPTAARHRSHDGAAAAIVSVFQAQGFRVAGGWRGDDYTGGKTAIAPDAMVYVGEGSSGGEGWHYVEYERRAGSGDTVAAKLKGYIARGSKAPVLVATRNDWAASEFRRQAAAAGLPLWAASIPEIRIQKPETIAGEATVWVDAAGQRAVLVPPSYGSRTAGNQGSGGIFVDVEAADPLSRTRPIEVTLPEPEGWTSTAGRNLPKRRAASALHMTLAKLRNRYSS